MNNAQHLDPPILAANAADLVQTITALNQAAYQLAQQAAHAGDHSSAYAAQAAALDARLADIAPRLADLALDEQAALAAAWTEARLDLDYVLSGGRQPTSIRLHHYLTGLRGASSGP